MENPSSSSSPKFMKPSPSSTMSSSVRGAVRCSQSQQPARLQSEPKGQLQERLYDKSKASNKISAKEQTRPLEIKLHTQERAAKRAEFNYFIASKISQLEMQRQLEQKLLKIIEEEEIRMMRKEMIPRAQLMPFFDRPFFPHRSKRPLTIPREPTFHMLSSKCWRCLSCSNFYDFQQPQTML
ncbi:PREDICTED: protein TPX2-like [Nelumbo nucifera]|uniref:TPX2 C-terminal domain-containing protein n=2 Tax=Nelumbo nucifera TaxID=4432 RepID=A0A822YTL0_NELNU|nr:PREDICTED: protein TPX2-like [Nelumbo nucifera]DAD35867.1 TPA_asm: hypothetical protein HUJ06_006507 [Nelumbo nucifera]